MFIDDLFEKKQKNIEKILEDVYEDNSYIFDDLVRDLQNPEYGGEGYPLEKNEDFEKEILSSTIFYFQLQMLYNKNLYKIEDKEKQIPVKLFNERASYSLEEVNSWIFQKVCSESLNPEGEDQLKEQNNQIQKYLEESKKDLKEIIQDFIQENPYQLSEVGEYFPFLQDEKQYVSSSLFIEVKKSLFKFAENGKCQEKTFTFVLAFYFDFINSKLDENYRFSQKVVDYIYTVAFMSDEKLFLSLLSNLVMNKIYFKNQPHFNFNYNLGDNSENLKKLKSEYPENFCLTFFEEDRLLLLFKIAIKLNKDLYEPLVNLYKNTFEENFLLKEDEMKFLEKVWSIKALYISENPGLLYCLCTFFKNIDKKDIFDFFEKTKVDELKEEYAKLNRLPDFRNGRKNQVDLEVLKSISDPLSQKKKNEAFIERLPLLEAVFFYRLYELYAPIFQNKISLINDSWTDEEKKQFSLDLEENHKSVDAFHQFFIRGNFTEAGEQKKILERISKNACNKNFFENLSIDFDKNSEEICRIVYFLYHSKKDNLHSFVDFLNHVREKQLKVLPVLPNRFETYTKEEAEAEKLRIEENQKILKEKIDFGYRISFEQPVSTILISSSPVLDRIMTIKTFTETDKQYTIFSKPKNKFLKLDKKEDFRVTNKNLLYNHYLYSDRNVFTHDAANYMVIEHLLDDEKTENLLLALMDIRKFLNKMRYDLCSDKKYFQFFKEDYNRYLLGIDYLLMDWNDISKKLLKKLIYADDAIQKDPWKAIIDDKNDTIREKYADRIKNLDYIHDLGKDFLDDLSKFLTNVYSAKPVFLENAGFAEYLYLIFQNFALDLDFC